MAQIAIFQRLLDAGADLTELTQRNAEKLVKSLVDAGEVPSEQAQKVVSDLIEQSRRNRERLTDLIDREVRAQVKRMGLASRADLEKLEQKVARLDKASKAKPKAKPGKGATAPTAKKTVKKTVKKKAPAKKAASTS
jgi:polyhydroxyalkanoate synthesis regulator phasin